MRTGDAVATYGMLRNSSTFCAVYGGRCLGVATKLVVRFGTRWLGGTVSGHQSAALPAARCPCKSTVPRVAPASRACSLCCICARRRPVCRRACRVCRTPCRCCGKWRDTGARSGPLQTRASGAAEHGHIHVRPQVRAAPRIRRGPEASQTERLREPCRTEHESWRSPLRVRQQRL